jgi:hypothetical protein
MGCRGDHGARACDPAPASLQTRNPQYCKRAIPWDIGEQPAAQILLVKPLPPCRTGGIIGIPWNWTVLAGSAVLPYGTTMAGAPAKLA